MSATSVVTAAARPLRLPLRGQDFALGAGPLLVGVIVTLPVVLLLANTFNVAAPGREATYGLDNWVRAFSDAGTLSALWNSVALGFVRTAISLPIAIAAA